MYKRIKNSNLFFNALPYNEMMTLYMSVGHVVKNYPIDEVRMIIEEMSQDLGSNEDRVRYINSNTLVEAEKGITQREWITYDFLIILYAGLGNKDKIDQIWKSLRMTKQKMTSRNYICILSSYLILGHLKEIGEVTDQWKQSTTTDFDVSASIRILDAFADVGLTEMAHNFHMLLVQKNSDPTSGS
ncbi:pentatricopeptide repeat-containing protein At5g09450, mitochondrial [Fagus crenata]